MSRKRQLSDLALEAAPFAVLCIDADGIVTLANNPMRTMFGMTSRDVGRAFRDLEVSYRPVELRSLIEQTYAEHRVIRLNSVERTVGADEVQYLDIHIQPLWGSDGMGAGVTVTFTDVTNSTRLQLEVKRHREELDTAYEELQSTNEELETTNEELQSSIEELETMNEELRIRTAELDEARTFLEGVLSSLAAGVVVLDAGMLVKSWNRGAEELWGLRADEVRNQPFFHLDFGLPTIAVAEMVQQCFASRQRTGPVEIAAISRIGRSIKVSVTCTPLDGHGEAVVLLMEEGNSR